MTHGTQAPETPDERAATHAPKTELPTMTQMHQWAVERAADTQLTLGFPAIHGYCYEASLIVRALVSGEARLVPTAPAKSLLDAMDQAAAWGLTGDGTAEVMEWADNLRRWLTPEDERHE